MDNENGCATQCEAPTPLNAPIGRGGLVAPAPEHYEVNIRKVENGFVLQFGCKTFVAQNWEEASTGIAEYWKDPRGAQKKYSR